MRQTFNRGRQIFRIFYKKFQLSHGPTVVSKVNKAITYHLEDICIDIYGLDSPIAHTF